MSEPTTDPIFNVADHCELLIDAANSAELLAFHIEKQASDMVAEISLANLIAITVRERAGAIMRVHHAVHEEWLRRRTAGEAS